MHLKTTRIEEVIAKTFLWISVLVTMISLFAIIFYILKVLIILILMINISANFMMNKMTSRTSD